MKKNQPGRPWLKYLWLAILAVAGIAAAVTFPAWSPHAKKWIDVIQNRQPESDPHDHAGHDDHAAHGDSPDTLKLTPTARRNIGLETGVVEPSDFVKEVSVPAIIVDRPGRSQIQITAPMTGVVTKVFPVERQVIQPGTSLFELRLTHEDLVSAQSELLKSLQDRDVVQQELARLRGIGNGVIPGKRIVEQKYSLDKTNATLGAMRQSLLLHGLSQSQVDNIERTRTVLQTVTVIAPPFSRQRDQREDHSDSQHRYHVQSISVNRGQSINAGQLLGVLADHCLLYVEGQAFENDANQLVDAMNAGTPIRVFPASGQRKPDDALNLPVQSVSDQVDENSRALKFYLLLHNTTRQPSRNTTPSMQNGLLVDDTQFVAWKFRPGQRMEALIPTESVMKNKIVLPAAAVVIDGPNAFVFEQNGSNFDRLDVHVLYRDKDQVVLENDGLLVGSTIAMNGAYRMHLALKNQSGGGIDPHAGHNH